jgi:hypothetical protein
VDGEQEVDGGDFLLRTHVYLNLLSLVLVLHKYEGKCLFDHQFGVPIVVTVTQGSHQKGQEI